MTLASTAARADYIGSGSTGPFSYPFKIFAATDLVVTKRSTTGTETTLSYPTEYTVSDVGETAGGSVTLSVALATGEALTIQRVVPLTQPTDFRNQGRFLPSTEEDALDRMVMQGQGVKDGVDRSFKLGPTYDPDDYTVAIGPATEDGQVLGWSDAGLVWRTVSDEATVLPGDGRTVGTVTRYLANNAVFNVKDFGAVGDGGTDDYAAIQRAITALTALGGGTLLFPPGTYKVNQYRITGGASQNAITNFTIAGLSGVQIIGWGAKLDIKGDFNRAADASGTTSYENSVTLELKDCTRVGIYGLELDGNVDQMTKDSGVVEGDNQGLRILSCTEVVLDSVYSHHWPTDGLYVGDSGVYTNPRRATRRLAARSCRFEYNARLGLGVIQLRDARFENCSFDLNGDQGFAYGFHAPQAGIDVEPNRSTTTAAPNQMDVNTGNLVFLNCTGVDNAAQAFATALPALVDSVGIDGGTWSAKTGASNPVITMDTANGFIRNALIDTKDQWVAFGNSVATNRLVMEDCVIRTTSRGILSATSPGRVYLRRVKIINEATATLTTFCPYLINTGLEMEDCHVVIPAAAHDGVTSHAIAQMTVKRSTRTTWETDLDGAGGLYFAPAYGTTTVVERDRFTSTNSSFRPSTAMSATQAGHWDFTNNGYSRLVPRPSLVSADRGNANFTLNGFDVPVQLVATTLTANRTITLSTTETYAGLVVRILRTDTGAFTLNVGGLKTIPAGTAAFVDVVFNGTAWTLLGYGTL